MDNTKNITSDQKSLIAFTLLLSDPAFAAWTGEQQITPVFKFLHNILSFSTQQNASGGRIVYSLRLNG